MMTQLQHYIERQVSSKTAAFVMSQVQRTFLENFSFRTCDLNRKKVSYVLDILGFY